MTGRTPEQFANYLQKRFNHSTAAETYALIITIWLVGTLLRLVNLGIVSGGEIKKLDGLDQWEEIDEHRFKLIPPNMLGQCLASFTKVTATRHLQEDLAQLIAMYYTDTGRQEIATRSFDRIFLNSSDDQ